MLSDINCQIFVIEEMERSSTANIHWTGYSKSMTLNIKIVIKNYTNESR